MNEGPNASHPAAALPPKLKRCPICGKQAVAESKPFCSKRCADVDLHRWLGGVYAVPVTTSSTDEEP